jgi:hypothetical protein
MRRLWRRLAALVALAYLGSVIAPGIALAVSDGAMTAYCFDEIFQPVAAAPAQPHVHVHVHADGTVHQHVDKKTDASQSRGDEHQQRPGSEHSSHDTNCCGLFGVTAVLPALTGAIAGPDVHRISSSMAADDLVGCGPSRIDRPPISPLPM